MGLWVFHADMDAFFASVSLLAYPQLEQFPVVVAGDPEQRHGVVLAKNQIAKNLGIKTAMSLAEARRMLPNLVTLPPEHAKYRSYSLRAQEIYRKHSRYVESFGLDECWLAVETADPLRFAKTLQVEIFQTLKLTVSIGIAKDKVMAKLASDMKKPEGIFIIQPDDITSVVWPLPVEKLLYVGKIAREKLYDLGINTIGELANCPEDVLCATLGKTGSWLHEAANGNNSDKVQRADAKDERKSISAMETLSADITNKAAASKVLELQLSELVASLKDEELRARSVQIWYKTNDFKTYTRQASLPFASDEHAHLHKLMLNILDEEIAFDKPIRALGVGLSLLESSSLPVQQSLEDFLSLEKSSPAVNSDEESDARAAKNIEMQHPSLTTLEIKEAKLNSVIDRLRQIYGDDSITRGQPH